MRIRIPSKKVCEKFHLTYELEGAKKAVRVLTKYYRIPTMKIILNGRRVMRACEADYFEGVACFTKRGLKKMSCMNCIITSSRIKTWRFPRGKKREKQIGLLGRL